jgi:hypothetical protein
MWFLRQVIQFLFSNRKPIWLAENHYFYYLEDNNEV